MAVIDETVPEQQVWTEVCKIDDLQPEMGICAKVDNRQVALFWLPDEDQSLYALDNFDPFSGANVISRGIVGDVQGELVVASPVYKQHFSLKSGRCIEDDQMTLPTYSVRIVDDRVQVAA